MKIYFNEKKGLYISFGKVNIVEFKTKGNILKHIETGEMIIVSDKLLETKFELTKVFKREI